MNTKPDSTIHFPTSPEKGAVPFPRSDKSSAEQQKADSGAPAEQQPASDAQLDDAPLADAEQAEPELSQEELRLMADTMPGDGPGD